MKRFILPILLFLMFIPFCVNAESKSLYEEMQNNSASDVEIDFSTSYGNGLFSRNTTLNDEYPIYYYRGNIDNNNVIFAEKCWKIVRTTDQGGIKLVYNGIPNGDACTNTGVNSMLVAQTFQNRNYYGSFAFGGYSYGDYYWNGSVNGQKENAYFGSTVTYEDGKYKLVNPKIGLDENHHYSCNSTNIDDTCSRVYFYTSGSYFPTSGYYLGKYYIILENGKKIDDAVIDMTYAHNDSIKSTAHNKLDNWYIENLKSYEDIIEDTNWCNEKKLAKTYWNENGYLNLSTLNYKVNSKYENEYPILNCETTMNVKSKYLSYPIALLTADEVILAGGSVSDSTATNDYYLRTGANFYYLLNPKYYDYSQGVFMYCINSYGGIDSCSVRSTITYLRPAISLKHIATYYKGDGSKNKPYCVSLHHFGIININNNADFGNLKVLNDDLLSVEESSLVNFTIELKKGYAVKKIDIIDSNNNLVEYQSNENDNEYFFVMPASNVTVTPIYEKVKSSINVEIVNETEDLTVEINDMTQVQYEEKVTFKVTPIKGYKVTNLKILDKDNNEIEYESTDNKNYTFTMPASDVTIIPSYERVSNAVNIEENKHTKKFVIEVNDSKAVVYEDKVKFRVVPEAGYEVEKIEIKDEKDNVIEYRKTDKENEYEFTMPDTDVVITLAYKKIELIEVPNTIKNPNTGTGMYVVISIIVFAFSLSIYLIMKKRKITL